VIPSLPRVIALFFASLALAGKASPAALVLSNASSDPSLPASRLDGLLELDVTGGGRTQRLTLTLTNATAAPDALFIDAILFDASAAVTSVRLDRVTASRGGNVTSAWSLVASSGVGGATDAGRLGLFDWALVSAGAGVAPGDVLTVRIDVTGSVRLETADFVEASALTGPGQIPTLGAGRFAAGGTRVYGGAHAPEPGSLALLCSGLFALALVRRRHRLHPAPLAAQRARDTRLRRIGPR